jgi:hypothetical protein
MLLPVSSNVGIDDTPFVDTWHGKPGDALLPQQSSAGNGASGLIAGSPSRPYSTRNASACSCCVAAYRRTPCRYGVIANHLPPCPTKPPTQRSSVIPSGIVVCCYHKGGGLDEPIVLVVTQVEGIGLVLQILEILEGGRLVCPWPSGLHKLRQHWTYSVFGRIILILNPTLPPMLLLHVSKRLTAFVLLDAIVVFSHLFMVLTSPNLAVPLSLTGMLPLKMPVIGPY